MKLIKVNVGTDTDAVLEYKKLIEDSLLVQNKINKRMSITEFVSYLDISKCIYVEQNSSVAVPFSIYNIDDTSILMFYAGPDDDALKRCCESLRLIGYNVLNLVPKSNTEVMENDLMAGRYFIINKQFYVLP